MCGRYSGSDSRREPDQKSGAQNSENGMEEGLRLIQSQAPDSGLASHPVSVQDSDLCPIPG
jgi:hypothetical protein